MSVYKTLVCHTCKKNYEAYKENELYGDSDLAKKEAEENHQGHDYEFAYDGVISSKNDNEVYEPDYEQIDLI